MKFPTAGVMFTLAKLDDDTGDGRIKELDSITLEKFSDDGTKELVLTTDLSVLLIVGTTDLTNDVDAGVSEVLFNKVVLSSCGVDDKTVRELVTKLLVTSDDATLSTEVVFRTRMTKLDEEEIEKVLVNLTDEMDDKFEALLLIDKLV